MSNKLNQLLGKPVLSPVGEITGVTHDSRVVNPGDVYVAVRGARHDGHAYIDDAFRAGATAVIVDREHASLLIDRKLPGWVVSNTRDVMGFVADIVNGHPTHRLHLVGVTGTNGKTSTGHIISYMAQGLFGSAGSVGTLGTFADGISLPSQRTTPEAPELQKIFSLMVAQSVRAVAMEVASHALVHGRVNGCLFDSAVFTNLTQDHLDFHGDMESYYRAKSLLFTRLLPQSVQCGKRPFAVVNIGSNWGRKLRQSLTETPTITYATSADLGADFTSENVCLYASSTEFDVRYCDSVHRVHLPLGGAFQVENALASLAWFVGAGGSLVAGIDLLRTCPQISGRFQVVSGEHPFTVVVDYAHTPDGLENLLRTARDLCKGNLITVFGCGGDRDKTKRPMMGAVAGRYSDVVIVTSDNPRSEDSVAIIDEIVSGIPDTVPLKRIPDRREAISAALQIANANDVVIIAGKGHETYQIIGDSILPFDDRCVAAEELSKCS
ncbi:MAG: UDP-N-acetylmuramoyl-L-alanyl-D-glutamate--2,6-diaminopimelate ligase [Armatimonadota bacterium]